MYKTIRQMEGRESSFDELAIVCMVLWYLIGNLH